MKEEKIRSLGKWLGDYHSHGVYAEGALEELNALGFVYKDGVLTEPDSGEAVRVPLQTAADVQREIEARGVGGSVVDTDERLWSGFTLAHVLSRWTLGTDPAAHLTGRGTRFRTQVQAMQQFGQKKGAA